MDSLVIRAVRVSDASDIARIYNHYVMNTVVSFEEEAIEIDEMQRRILDVIDINLPWLVAERQNDVVGFAYASKWKGRCAYRNSLETTIYLDLSVTGQGMGFSLYDALIKHVRSAGFHTVIGGVALPNESSVALHEKLGFRKVAHFEQVGFKCDRWVDVAYWQLLL
jgi:L-amino acid N-acyltransferase YncA